MLLQKTHWSLYALVVSMGHRDRFGLPCGHAYRILHCGCVRLQVSIFFIDDTWVEFTKTVLSFRPLSAFWSPLATYPKICIDEGNYMLSFSIITIFLDFILLLLPVPIVVTLQLSTKQRLAVCGLFFLGFIICIAGIIQAYYVDKALIHSYDETWDGWPLWVASAIEVDLGIVSIISASHTCGSVDRL